MKDDYILTANLISPITVKYETAIMEFDELSEAQRFAIEYLIRGLVISKITYLIASNKTDG